MQKAKSVRIIKNNLIFLIFLIYSVSSFSQKSKIISIDDYSILNKSIERYFYSKRFNDSLFYNSDVVKKNLDTREIKRAIKRKKKRDTLYIKSTSDKFYYGRFLKNDARWKREKWYKKIKVQLDSIFSESEVVNYKKQLKDNNYVWNKDKIDFKNRVFVISDLYYTRGEVSEISKTKRDSFLRKNSKLTKSKNVYVFSKPIFSIDKNLALITYSGMIGDIFNNVLLIYEKKKNEWHFKHLISENGFVDKLEER